VDCRALSVFEFGVPRQFGMDRMASNLLGDGDPSSPTPPKAGARRARLYGSMAPGDN